MKSQTYAYRVIDPNDIEERLNEAKERGWELHTFYNAPTATGSYASAVFRWVGLSPQLLPFSDDIGGTHAAK